MSRFPPALLAGLVMACLTVLAGAARADSTLDSVRARGVLVCGVGAPASGFSDVTESGQHVGLDVDYCRAVAAAALGDSRRVRFIPLSAQTRFEALTSGQVDLLARTATWTLSRDAGLKVDFVAVNFYDGQAFIARASAGLRSLDDAKGAKVCAEISTTSLANLEDHIAERKRDWTVVTFQSREEARLAFLAGRCDFYTADFTILANLRIYDAPRPDDLVILPERISREPLSLAVRHGDDQWADLVRWVHFAMVLAEQKGITSTTLDLHRDSPDSEVRRLLGHEPELGEAMGLDGQWAARVIRQVGNYGELFERNIGKASRLKLDRGLNDLWTRGGLMYAPPFR